MSSRGLSPFQLGNLAREERLLEASCAQALLKVGRGVQLAAFWAALLPDQAMRNTVSREHFQIEFDELDLCLLNFSSTGTIVNRKLIHDRVRVQDGDVISIGWSSHDPTPMVHFRLTVAASEHNSANASYMNAPADFELFDQLGPSASMALTNRTAQCSL